MVHLKLIRRFLKKVTEKDMARGKCQDFKNCFYIFQLRQLLNATHTAD